MKAYTLVEIVLALAIASLVLVMGVFATHGTSFVSDVLRTETDSVISVLRKAQLESMYGMNSSDHRVRFDPDRITVMPRNEVTLLSGVTVSWVQLTGPGNEITFSHQFGRPSVSGNVVLQGPRGALRTIVISPEGTIAWQ